MHEMKYYFWILSHSFDSSKNLLLFVSYEGLLGGELKVIVIFGLIVFTCILLSLFFVLSDLLETVLLLRSVVFLVESDELSLLFLAPGFSGLLVEISCCELGLEVVSDFDEFGFLESSVFDSGLWCFGGSARKHYTFLYHKEGDKSFLT